jgi:signal transduction histidine kinase/CheY-like chemotaxis protein
VSEVSCRALEPLFRLLAEKQIPVARWLEGTALEEAALRDLSKRIGWGDFVLLHERLALILGGYDEYEDAGARFQESASLLAIMRTMALFASVQQVYWAADRWVSTKLFSNIRSKFTAKSPTVTEIVCEIPEPFQPSIAFFRFNAGTFRAAPRMFGQPDAIVTSKIQGRICVFTIEHVPSMTIFSRIRHAFLTLFAAKRVFGELRAQNDDLHQRIKELSEARRVAETASRVRTQFIANVGHELRTPLNGVIGLTELLLDANLDTQQREYTEALRDSAGALHRLVNGVLDFSDLQGGRLDMDAHEVDVHALLGQLETFARSQLKEKTVGLHVRIAPTVPKKIRGSELRIRQVLQNLLDNAVKFTERGSIVLDVGTEHTAEGSRVLFQVIDTGIGIPDEWRENLFRPFVQKDGSFTRAAGGTGLGLAIAQQLSQLMGGLITATSELGRGSTFVLSIPLEAEDEARVDPVLERAFQLIETKRRTGDLPQIEAPLPQPVIIETKPAPAPAPASAPQEHRGGARLLVVEDNLVNQKVLVRHLEKLGFSVDVAQNGLEAVELTGRNTYAVVFMDLQMPVMDGFEATARIREREGRIRHTPIIAVTAHIEEQFVDKARACGIDEHLGKPIQRDRIASALARWMPQPPSATSLPF